MSGAPPKEADLAGKQLKKVLQFLFPRTRFCSVFVVV